jgi:hypothetical protein
LGVPTGENIIFQVTFTNDDPQQRSVTIWPQSALGVQSVCSNTWYHNCGGAWYSENMPFYIISGINAQYSAIIAYSVSSPMNLPYGVPTTLYFGANAPLSSTDNGLNNWAPESPFEAMFALVGVYSDGSFYGQTIPFPAGVVTAANAYTTPVFGNYQTTVTVSCTPSGYNGCYFLDSASAFVGFVNSAGKMQVVQTFITTSNGQIPTSPAVTFQVPSDPQGYYTIIVSDYVNSVFMTFYKTDSH